MKLYKTFGKLSEKQISDLENQLNVKLPDDYKNFLAQTNGATLDPYSTESFLIRDINEPATLDILFGLTSQDSSDLLYWNKTYGDEMVENSVIIGMSLEHSFIVLICDGEYAGVYCWDDCHHYSQSSEESNTYFIAETFTDLLNLC